MKRKIFYVCLTLFSSCLLLAKQRQYKNVVFDLDGVLLWTDNFKAGERIGFGHAAAYLLWHKKKPTVHKLFEPLYDVAHLSTDKSVGRGEPMPGILVDWQTGAQSNEAIHRAIRRHLKKKKFGYPTGKILRNTLRMMFDPHKLVSTRKILRDGVDLFDEAVRGSQKVYILSNWDRESFDHLVTAFPFIEHADGYMVSGQEGMLKPNANFYEHFLKTFGLKPEETIFFDDEPANVEGARKVGIRAYHCTGKNYPELRALMKKKISKVKKPVTSSDGASAMQAKVSH